MGRVARFDIRRMGRNLLLVYLTLLVFNGVFFVVMTQPKRAEYRALTVDTAPARLQLEQLRLEVEDKEAYLAALDRAEENLVRLRREVLSTRPRRLVAAQLEVAELCRRFNINLDRVNYQNELLEEENLHRLGMVVPLQGGYQALRNFIQAVENSDEFLVIERVSLGQGREGGVMLELNITLATYFDVPEDQRDRTGRRRATSRT